VSQHGTINLPFGNGEYDFNVAKHKQLFELQDRCGLTAIGPDGERILIPCGPFEIFERLRGHRWREADVREPIRLGLIGGGLEVRDAVKLMTEFVDDQPLGVLAPLAARIVHAAVFGVAGDSVGKKRAGRTSRKAAGGTASSAPLNTAPEPRLDLPHATSTT
jgi:hypothetical protein